MRHTLKTLLLIGALAAFFSGNSSLEGASVLSYHNDSISSGVNSFETVLTPANLTVSTFGKLYSTAVDGQIYAQPLYVPSVVVTGGAQAGTHNLMIVATQHDSLYAIDAASGVIVWQTSFVASGLPGATTITSVPSTDTGSTNTSPEIGICCTPVIDSSTNLLYVVAKTKQILNGVTTSPNYVYTLYVIDITNGNATANANIVNSTVIGDTVYSNSTYSYRTNAVATAAQDPFVPGTADDAIMVGGQSRVYFNALRELNRAGLILAGGSVYIAFASQGDVTPYHGWMLGYDKGTLAVTAVLNLTPNGGQGGIWQGGGIPTVDANGNFYLMTGNGTFDGFNTGGVVTGLNGQGFPVNGDYGDSVVKISTDTTTSPANQNINGWGLKVVDYFAPFNNQALSSADSDLGSGGCTLLPDSAGSVAHPHLLVGSGKQGNVYLIDRDSMGKFSATTDNVVQSQVAIGGSFDTPAFFNGQLYYVGDSDNGKAFTIANAVMSTTPVTTPDIFSWPGSTPSISANGTTNGVVWTMNRNSGQLRAYSAANFKTEIWTSALAPNKRDQLGAVTKFATPTIADGRVMVGTTTALVVYSIISGTPPPTTPPTITTSSTTGISASSATLNGTVNPKGSAATVYFQYGTTTTTYTNTTSGQSEGSGKANVTFSTGVSELAPATPYHYRAVATNGTTTVYGADKTFTTLAAPVIGTNPAAYLAASGAEVTLSVNPNGLSTSVYFQYATNSSFTNFIQTAAQNVGKGKVAVNVYALFPNLLPNQIYYYRMVTTSAAGTFYGPPEFFTTLPFDTALVVQKGDFAVGSSGPTFASFGNPAVNAGDNVAFAGTLTTGAGGVTTSNDIGIWADDNTGTRQLVTQIGTAAPGTSGTFLTLSDPAYNSSEAVAFRGTLKVATGQATSTTAAGIWSTSSGSLALVARQGSQAPGCPTGATFNAFTSLGLSDSGGAIIFATLNTNTAAGVTSANNVGVWEGNTAGDLALVLRLGGSVGGKTITGLTFLPTETYVNGQTRGFDSASGDIVCGATFSDATTGIVTVVNGTASIAALSGTPAGVTGATFASFGSPAINTNDYTAFEATLTTGAGGVTTSNNASIWADNNTGTLQLIAQTGSGAAPGTTANFLTFSDPVYNNNEAVAFRATLKVAPGQATSTTATGIWCNSTGSLALVAQQGSQASGCPTGATFNTFTELALADQGGATNQGGVMMLATLNTNSAAGVSTTNNLGIWAVDTTGTLQLIVRTGDTLNGKTVTGLAFLPALSTVNGQSRSFAQGNGDLVYLATFSDKSTAIFNVVFP